MISSDKVYQAVLPVLENIEHSRQALLLKSKRILIVGGFWALLVSGFITSWLLVKGVPVLMWWVALFPFVILIVVRFLMISGPRRRYREAYKESLIPSLLKEIDESLRFEQGRGMGRKMFVASRLYQTNPDRYHSEDFISGFYGDTEVHLSEVHAEKREQSRDSKGNTKTSYVTFFKGVFMVVDFNKDCKGETFVLPDIAESMLGRFGRKLQKLGRRSGTVLSQLDHPEFEKSFVVYTSDEVECRYLLTPSFMERMLGIQQKFGKSNVRFLFKDSKLWIALSRNENFLEPHYKSVATNKTEVRRIFEELVELLNLVEELDLNTRIWGKAPLVRD